MLGLIVEGHSNKEIAAKLGLAEITVKQHVSNVLEKLGVQDRTQAATAAIQRGIVHLEQSSSPACQPDRRVVRLSAPRCARGGIGRRIRFRFW